MMETGLTELSSLLEDFKLTEEGCDKQISDTHLEEISCSCCSRWRSLPPHLELQKLVVEDINSENKIEEEKRNTFFFTWKHKKGSDATYRKLIGALLKIECREDAEKVCKLLQRSVSTQQPNSNPSVKSKPASDTGETQTHQTSTNIAKAIIGLPGPSEAGPEWTNLSGKVAYSAGGHRDVLLIVSEDGLSHPDVVQRRPAIELTEETREELEKQGIAREDHWNDLTLAKARYSLDSERTVHGVEMSQPDGERLTKESVLRQMHTLINENRDKSQGVVFYYIGHGRRNTGDWCFEDGFITFRDLADLYLQLLRGRVMTIVTDCSYSGCWVKECMTFLDEQGVGPCGHLARDKGLLIKVYASCLSHQIPRQLVHSVYGCKNDKDTGLLSFKLQDSISLDARIASAQHISSVDFTQVRCGQMSIEDKCLCLPQATWQAWHAEIEYTH